MEPLLSSAQATDLVALLAVVSRHAHLGYEYRDEADYWAGQVDPGLDAENAETIVWLVQEVAGSPRLAGAHGVVGPELGGQPRGAYRRHRERLTTRSAGEIARGGPGRWRRCNPFTSATRSNVTKVIERNTTIPTRLTEVFSTAEDNQPTVDVVVLQGERERATDNRVLGRFRLESIRPGQGHRRPAADHHPRERQPRPRRDRAHGRRGPAQPGRGPADAPAGRRPQRAGRGRLPGRAAGHQRGGAAAGGGPGPDGGPRPGGRSRMAPRSRGRATTTAVAERKPKAREAILAEARRQLRPGYLIGVDDIVLFNPLTLPQIERIVDLRFDELRRRLADRRMTVELTDEPRLLIAARGSARVGPGRCAGSSPTRSRPASAEARWVAICETGPRCWSAASSSDQVAGLAPQGGQGERGPGAETAERLRVQGIPTLLLGDDREVARQVGAAPHRTAPLGRGGDRRTGS